MYTLPDLLKTEKKKNKEKEIHILIIMPLENLTWKCVWEIKV